MATAIRRTSTGRAKAPPAPRFDQRLVLNRWMLQLFGIDRFEQFTDALSNPQLESFDDENISRFHPVVAAMYHLDPSLTRETLLEYDQNIVRHWHAITDARNRTGHQLYPKYFQYLALLFAEIYLDRLFRDREALLAELNKVVAGFNLGKSSAERIAPYEAEQLSKLAFWNATGSGKTLLMHINILQYRHYLKRHGRERELNRTILLTPNEGLSRQHLDEFEESGIDAELFSKDSRGLFAGTAVEIIDINKLKDEMGIKTVAIDAFEGNNLVLVDEGHRGSSGVDWKSKRDKLSEAGFSFEYSATFGQAVRASKKADLAQEYAKCILFDYSYKFFYRDGYGKDYHILNLEDDSKAAERQLYLTACLLVFYQQLCLYHDQHSAYQQFLIEAPLWVFVGGSVNAVRMQDGKQVSDIVDILRFLASFVHQRYQSENVARIERLLGGKAGLLDGAGREIFANAFAYLTSLQQSGDELYTGILRLLFDTQSPGMLHVEHLKGTEGEIALRVGTHDEFGVINVGDAASLIKLCRENDDLLVVDERDFAGSLFAGINDADSPIKVLIGSKKFTEGWNSWRVSTMGLMNIGQSEGAQIIQLFGRGVRLKGYGFSLKRSSQIQEEQRIPAPDRIKTLETLSIFGIRANYMRQFREYLEEEGLPARRIEFVLPVVRHLEGINRLQTIRVKPGIDFKTQGPKPVLQRPEPTDHLAPVTLDWYPRLQSARSKGIRVDADAAVKHEATLTEQHIAFMELDAIFFELEQLKNERGWYNLELSRDKIRELLLTTGWYKLLIPPQELEFSSFDRVRTWQEIAIILLKKYCNKYYKYRKNAYELPHLEYRALQADDSNFV